MKRRRRSLTRSELEECVRDFVTKVVAELREHGELLTVTYLLMGNDFVLVPTFYRTSMEKQVATAAIDALIGHLNPRAVFYVARGWVSDDEAAGCALGTAEFGAGNDLVAYNPGDPAPTGSRNAFCVLARTASQILIAVTPYRIEERPEGRNVR